MTAILLAVALAGQAALPADAPPPGDGPRATSDAQRYDAVVRAGVAPLDAPGPLARATIAARSPAVSAGGYVELTALDSGRTIVALAVGPVRGNRGVELSPGAAQALGIAEGAPVRVRAVTPLPVDQDALKAGRAASPRIDAPPMLLAALRKRIAAGSAVTTPEAKSMPQKAAKVSQAPAPGFQAARPMPVANPATPPAVKPTPAAKPAAPPPVKPAPGAAHAVHVQVAALSSEARAQALVRELGGGRVVLGGGVFRVQLGPFASVAEANRARDAAARHGYAGGHIVTN